MMIIIPTIHIAKPRNPRSDNKPYMHLLFEDLLAYMNESNDISKVANAKLK